jgi:hypothetical protein
MILSSLYLDLASEFIDQNSIANRKRERIYGDLFKVDLVLGLVQSVLWFTKPPFKYESPVKNASG